MKKFCSSLCTALLMVIAPCAIAQFTFIPGNAPDWRYLDNGSDQGTAWSAAMFDDASWPTGTAEFGYGDGDEATVVSFGPDAANKYVTTYFRKYFFVTNAAQWSDLTLRLVRDDGAVVYLNGTEVSRQNMPAGPIDYQTLAVVAINPPDESTFFEQSVSPALLVNGVNTIAVEIHQVNVTSSDISFNLELIGTSTTPTRPTIVTQPQSQSVPEGSDVTFSVTATGTQPLRYRWRRNGVTLPGATNSSLTLFSVTSSNAGNYSVIVTNIAGSAISSNAVLTVTPANTNTVPVVNWVRPTNGATFPSGSTILMTASATDSDGSVSYVEFFADGTSLGQVISGTNIYNGVWSNAPAGTHQLHAEAVDNAGGRGVSASVQITVGSGGGTNTIGFNFISRGASDWRYLDNGSDQGIAWSDRVFDDSAWPLGTAQLGYGDGDESTVVSFGPDPANKYITTYFRKAFAVTNAAQWSNVTLRLMRDDGAVVYLNGTEISRQNMPAGPINYQTFATLTVNPPDESTFFEESVSPGLLVTGQNTIAVEIHQVNPASSDISFDLELVGIAAPATTRPTIVTQPQSQTVPPGSDVTFSVTTTGTEPLGYRWRRNAITIPGATNSTLTLFSVTSSNAGNYSVLVTNIAGSALSSNAVLTVISTNNSPPTVTLISPTNGQTFRSIQPIVLRALSSDPDGTVSFVDFFANTTRVARAFSTTGTFTTIWSNAPPGSYEVRAVATDNQGAQASSASASITVLSNRPPTALDQSVAVQEDSSLAITLTGTDPDGDFLTFVVLTLPAHGTLSGAAPSLTYTPEANYFGQDSFTFAVRDRQVQSAPATVQITVTPVNDAPVARLQIENTVTFLDEPAIITLDPSSATVVLDGSQSSDIENDPLTYTWFVGDPPQAFATGIRVTNELAAGSYVFQLQVSDGQLTGADHASVDILTPCDAIALIILRIDGSSHPNGIKRPLIDTLVMSCEQFDKGKVDKGIQGLEAFQDKVAVKLGPIDSAFAELLISAAQTIIDAVSP
jgi:hypothetical protein